ncbi:MAG: histidine kinase, partial [Bacteroidota bacterium]
DWEGIKNHFLIGFKLGLGYSTLVSVIYEAIYFYQMWKKSVTHSEMLLRQQVETQLESLKNQVNPHFLFNSLNTLTSLIPRNPDNAIKFVNKLSQVYRYVLEVNASQMIPLWQELQFMDAYLFLLKERHGEKLQVEMDIPEGFHNHKVISLVLQILLENAVKHNVVSQKKPLKVQVFVEDDALWVVNPLQPKSMPLPSTGLGLKNIAERYDLLAGEGMVIDQTETEFRVGVPLIQEKVEVYN